MNPHTTATAITLYRSGTLSLEQAACLCGRSEAAMRAALRRYAVPVRDPAGGRGH